MALNYHPYTDDSQICIFNPDRCLWLHTCKANCLPSIFTWMSNRHLHLAWFLSLLICSSPFFPILISSIIIHQRSCSSKNLYILWFFSLPCSIFYPEANPDHCATKIYLEIYPLLSISATVTSVYDTAFSHLHYFSKLQTHFLIPPPYNSVSTRRPNQSFQDANQLVLLLCLKCFRYFHSSENMNVNPHPDLK